MSAESRGGPADSPRSRATAQAASCRAELDELNASVARFQPGVLDAVGAPRAQPTIARVPCRPRRPPAAARPRSPTKWTSPSWAPEPLGSEPAPTLAGRASRSRSPFLSTCRVAARPNSVAAPLARPPSSTSGRTTSASAIQATTSMRTWVGSAEVWSTSPSILTTARGGPLPDVEAGNGAHDARGGPQPDVETRTRSPCSASRVRRTNAGAAR